MKTAKVTTVLVHLGSSISHRNVILGHLNINSVRNKFNSISEMIEGKLDIVIINKTQLDESFPSVIIDL